MVIWTESNFAQAFVTGGWEDVYDVPEHEDDHDHNLVTRGWEDADEILSTFLMIIYYEHEDDHDDDHQHKDEDDHDHNLAQAFVTGGWEDADEAQKQRSSLAQNNSGTAF